MCIARKLVETPGVLIILGGAIAYHPRLKFNRRVLPKTIAEHGVVCNGNGRNGCRHKKNDAV